MSNIKEILPKLGFKPAWVSLNRCLEGYHAFMLADIFQSTDRSLLFVASDDASMAITHHILTFINPNLPILEFPAWDCLPYDRVSPRIDIMAERMATLADLYQSSNQPRIIITTAAALLQRVPPKKIFKDFLAPIKQKQRLDLSSLIRILATHGFLRVDTVREPGEFAVRGGIVDLFPSSYQLPVRIDFFGDEIEAMHHFDPLTQRRGEVIETLNLVSASELIINEDLRAHFLSQYQRVFGDESRKDPIYVALKEDRHPQGIEHLLPLIYDDMSTLFEYLENPIIACSYQAMEALKTRDELINDYYQARCASLKLKDEVPYRSLEPSRLYWPLEDCLLALNSQTVINFSPFQEDETSQSYDCQTRPLLKPFDQLKGNIFEQFKQELNLWKKPLCLVTCYSQGSKVRLQQLLKDNQIKPVESVSSWEETKQLKPSTIALTTLDLNHGFISPNFVVVTEQDLLGERLTRPHRRQRRPDLIIHEASSLSPGDYVVHLDHGVGQFEDLVTIDAGGALHDCLCLIYAQGDKLFIPVENIDVLSRFGAQEGQVTLDRLGGTAWQARKAKVKERIKDIADKLLQVAAERKIRIAEKFVDQGVQYNQFCARFPYLETDDQIQAITDTLEDLSEGKPMDRLVCGDVGFGKTEVALRAAFMVASHGKQVAVITPTTLLCRQHFQTFKQRFQGLDINIEQLSRFVTQQQKETIRQRLSKGDIQIVIGTHALLAKSIAFDDLGLVIVDEEQHFGVTQKEKLKQLKSDVHVLTLTATPIPRTLQMALAGVRDMSIIATPPVDRLAIRTFVTPFDGVIIREAIMREHFRGGQVFYVCPRIADLSAVYEELKLLVPEVKIATAHGQMPTSELEKIMVEFYQGNYDVLLSTNIIESGIDIPTANTLIIHRADMFGLAQLYQLRGRIGRAKQRGYAYLTLPHYSITEPAKKRLEVMQTLDSLGAGFQLASYDMDIRGAGNLLGDEQSGHIREVGVELYQQMLEEAIHSTKAAGDTLEAVAQGDAWSPQINLGISVLIPEDYVNSLPIRLSLYRRISSLKSAEDIDAFAAEMIDRFGPLPEATQNLFEIVHMKELCKGANIEKLEAGEKGATIYFRKNKFSAPERLVQFIQLNLGKVRADQSVFFARAWQQANLRQQGVKQLLTQIASLAQKN